MNPLTLIPYMYCLNWFHLNFIVRINYTILNRSIVNHLIFVRAPSLFAATITCITYAYECVVDANESKVHIHCLIIIFLLCSNVTVTNKLLMWAYFLRTVEYDESNEQKLIAWMKNRKGREEHLSMAFLHYPIICQSFAKFPHSFPSFHYFHYSYFAWQYLQICLRFVLVYWSYVRWRHCFFFGVL